MITIVVLATDSRLITSIIATLDLDYLTDVEESSSDASKVQGAAGGETKQASQVTAFDRLVLPQGHRPMIQSLIAQHFRDKELKGAQSEKVDIVRGKGE